MDFSNLTSIINILIALFLLIGIMFGIKRGALKSFVRLSFLIFNCIFWLSFTPFISKLILYANLNPLLNVEVGNETIHTLADLTNYFIHSSEIVLEFSAANPIFASFIGELPLIAANFIVFITGYFLLKSITLPLYSYVVKRIYKLIIMKKASLLNSSKRKIRSRFFGAIFGVMQSALTGMILFMPFSAGALIFSTLNTATLNNTPTMNISQTVNLSSSENTGEIIQTNPIPNEMDEFINIYYNTLLPRTLRTMQLNNFNEFIFSSLSSVEIDGTTISLAKELKASTEIINDLQLFLYKNNITNLETITESQLLVLLNNADYNELETIVDEMFELKLLTVMGSEILEYVYSFLTNDETSLDNSLTALLSSDTGVLSKLMNPLKTGNTKQLKEQIVDGLHSLNVLQENKLFGFVKNSSTLSLIQHTLQDPTEEKIELLTKIVTNHILTTLDDYTKEELETNLIGPLFKTTTIRRIMPDIMNIVVSILNDSLDINLTPINRLSVYWQNEIEAVSNLIYLAKELDYNLLQTSLMEPFKITNLATLPLDELGQLLNIVKTSKLFNYFYYNLVEQLLNKYSGSFTGSEESLTLEYIHLGEIDWQKEFNLLQNSIVDVITLLDKLNQSGNITTNDYTYLQNNLTEVLNSSLIKEVLFQSSSILPNLLTQNLNNASSSSKLQELVTTIMKNLQEMSVADMEEDARLFINLLNTFTTLDGSTLEEKLLNINKTQLETMLNELNSIHLIKYALPITMNWMIETINGYFAIDVNFVSETFLLTKTEISNISTGIIYFKNAYKEWLELDVDLTTISLETIKTILETVNLPNIGEGINFFNKVKTFQTLYVELAGELLLQKETLLNMVPVEVLQNLTLTPTQLKAINWNTEFCMLLDAFEILNAFTSVEQNGYSTVRVDVFIEDYASSILLSTAIQNGLYYLFPETSFSTIQNLDIQASKNTIGGIAEIVGAYLQFKYHGTIALDYVVKYRMREAVKQVGTNPTLVAFIEESSGVTNGINYSDLGPMMNILFDALEGKEFSVNALSPYLDVAPLIPWIVELIEKFSLGYKMPYYLNVYAQIGLFNSRIQLYSIHIGKAQIESSSEPQPETEKEMDPQAIVDLLTQLSYIPDFVTAQFVYDESFTQPVTVD